MTNSIEKSLRDLFKKLNKNVEYVYFRDSPYLFNTVLQDPKNNDIDVLISRKDIRVFSKILFEFGYVTLQKVKLKTRKVGFFNYKKEGFPVFDVQLDTIGKMRYVSGKEFLQNRMLENDLFVLNQKYKLFILLFKDLFLHSFFGKKNFSKSKIVECKKLWEHADNKDFFSKKCSSILGTHSTKKFINLVDKGLFTKIYSVKWWWSFSAILKNPFFIVHIFQNLYQYLWYSRKNNNNLVMSVLGVDGSGKSSTISSVLGILQKGGVRSKSVYMGRWIRMKSLNRIAKVVSSKKSKRKSIKWFSKCTYIVRDFLYLLRYARLYFFVILPSKKKYSVVLTDRYMYDIHIQKKKTSVWDWCIQRYPKPDVLVLLYDDPRKIFLRKKEKSPEELNREQEILRGIVLRLKGTIVKADSLSNSVEKVFRILLLKRNSGLYHFLKR